MYSSLKWLLKFTKSSKSKTIPSNFPFLFVILLDIAIVYEPKIVVNGLLY